MMIVIEEKIMIKKLLIKLFIKYMLPKHKFLPTDIIKRPQSDVLFEVLACYYNKELEPVMEIQMYNTSNRGFVSGKLEIEAYHQYKKATPGSPVYD